MSIQQIDLHCHKQLQCLTCAMHLRRVGVQMQLGQRHVTRRIQDIKWVSLGRLGIGAKTKSFPIV